MPDLRVVPSEPPERSGTVTVLFLCTGNICRSPYAAARATETFPPGAYRFLSAGTHAIVGSPASPHAVTVGSERGLDLTGFVATSLADVAQPDVVFGMEQHHLVAARAQFPGLSITRIRLLAHPEGIPDPYGLEIDDYRAAADMIDEAIKRLDLASVI